MSDRHINSSSRRLRARRARVIYRDSWGTQRPAIMKKHNWKTTPGEVLILDAAALGKTVQACAPLPVLVPARLN